VAIADIRVMQPEGEITYSDLAMITYEAVFPPRSLSVAGSQPDLGTMDQFRNTTLAVDVTSNSPDTELLEVEIKELPGGAVSPLSLEVPPNATTRFELSVGSTEVSKPGSGAFNLLFSSPDPELSVNNCTLTYQYRIAYGLEVVAVGTDLGRVDNLSDVKTTLAVRSNAPVEQTLQVAVVSPAGSAVWPTRIVVPPREETTFTLSVKLPEAAPEEGKFLLTVASLYDAVEVRGGQVTYTYQSAGLGPLPVCFAFILVLALALVGFILWRRSGRTRRRRV
jgi:hypothetical protein